MAIRYQWQSSCVLIKCNGCSANFTLQHALHCKTGGLVIQRHNKVRDCLGDMAAKLWSQVVREPIVKEAECKADGPGLRADLCIRGVWTPQVEALFDLKVIDTDAASHLHRTPESILDSGALEKKKLYKKAVEDRRGTFTPFVISIDGLLYSEAEHFLKHISTSIAAKWEKLYAETCAFIRARLLFALVRASSLCLSGLGFDDGASLPTIMQ